MASIEVRFVRRPNGVAVAFAERGVGPVLVRSAHWMTHVEQDARSPIWAPWIDRLSARHRLVRYDAPGTGRSDAAPGPVTLADDVDALGAVIDALGVPRVALLAPSHGSAAAIVYAARQPERVACLTILGGFARGLLARAASDRALAYHDATARLIELGWGQAHPELRRMLTQRMVPNASAQQIAAITELQRTACSPARAAEIFRSVATLDVTEHLGAIRCPTLILHSDRDGTVPLEEGRLLASSIPGARLVTLDTDNHIPLHGEPAFEAAIAAIERLVAESGQAEGALPKLTLRELALARGLARGLDNVQLAAELGVSEKTVRNAVSALYGKLGVEGRVQAILRLQRAGLDEQS